MTLQTENRRSYLAAGIAVLLSLPGTPLGDARAATQDLDPAWQLCESVEDCAVGMDPCGEYTGYNKRYERQYHSWSQVTPWHCRRRGAEDRLPMALACFGHRCTVGTMAGLRRVEPDELPTPSDWKPYILRDNSLRSGTLPTAE